MSNIQDIVLGTLCCVNTFGTLCSVNDFTFLEVSSIFYFFFDLFNLWLVLLYLFAGKFCVFHKVINWNNIADLKYPFQKVIGKQFVFLVGNTRLLFENFGL